MDGVGGSLPSQGQELNDDDCCSDMHQHEYSLPQKGWFPILARDGIPITVVKERMRGWIS